MAGEIALFGGMYGAIKFLRTEDNMERALIQGIAYNARELSRKLDSELANKIAAQVSKMFGGK